MGQCHIVTIYEDGISHLGKPRFELSEEVGKAVLEVCLTPTREWTESGPQRVKDAKVGTHGNCVTWVDDVHSSEDRVYVFMGNCLRPLSQLSREEKQSIEKWFEEQIKET